MNKFAIVIPYFGKFKQSFQLFYESCRRNPTIDWIFFTDNENVSNPAPNVKWNRFTLSDFNKLIIKNLEIDCTLDRPYKLCDFKPMYGVICQEFLEGYEYWGYGDVDLIYGDIQSFLDRIDYAKYKKINRMGHLCFIKNEKKCNEAFKIQVDGTMDWKEVINSVNVGFDEKDLNVKFKAAQLTMYDGLCAADINAFEHSMMCVDLKSLRLFTGCKDILIAPKNYRYQIFVSLYGKIYRYYWNNNKIKRDEFCYIHFRGDPPFFEQNLTDTFIVSRKGFFRLDINELENKKTFFNLVDKYNHKDTFFESIIRSLKVLYKKTKKRLRKFLKINQQKNV